MLEITQITKKASSNVTDFKVEFIEAHWGGGGSIFEDAKTKVSYFVGKLPNVT